MVAAGTFGFGETASEQGSERLQRVAIGASMAVVRILGWGYKVAAPYGRGKLRRRSSGMTLRRHKVVIEAPLVVRGPQDDSRYVCDSNRKVGRHISSPSVIYVANH